jgi:hypothetical protein
LLLRDAGGREVTRPNLLKGIDMKTDLDFNIPDDFLLGLSLARRWAQFLIDERARTGLTEQQIIEKAGGTFSETDKEQIEFLNSLEGDLGHDDHPTGKEIVGAVSKEMTDE